MDDDHNDVKLGDDDEDDDGDEERKKPDEIIISKDDIDSKTNDVQQNESVNVNDDDE